MKIPGLKTARNASRRLFDRLRPGALVLGYHRITPGDSDPYGLCVSPEHFRQQLSVLRRTATPVPLSEISERMRSGGIPARAVALTFDDGYVDGLSDALPALRRQGIPATFFIVAGNRGGLFWWDELQLLVHRSGGEAPDPDGREESPGRSRMAAAGRRPRESPVLATYRSMLALSQKEREAMLDRYRERVDIDHQDVENGRTLTERELIELASDSLVEIGSHTVSHPRLTDLPAEARRREIDDSIATLRSLLKREIVSFSYPNGARDASLEPLLKSAGVRLACSSHPGLARHLGNPLSVPRYWVPDLDGVAFEHWLLARLPRDNS